MAVPRSGASSSHDEARCWWCSAPLPEDLFSGLEDLTLTLGAPAAQPEQQVSKPLEEAIAACPGAADVAQLSPGQLPRQVLQYLLQQLQHMHLPPSKQVIKTRVSQACAMALVHVLAILCCSTCASREEGQQLGSAAGKHCQQHWHSCQRASGARSRRPTQRAQEAHHAARWLRQGSG